MHESIAICTFAILAVTALVSFQGFRNPALVERLIFHPAAILRDKEYYRLLTSGFLHADWTHLLLNGFSFYAFGTTIELIFGVRDLVLIYFGSIVGGGLLSLFLHRHHDYRALGASGGVCGVIFASIFLLPGGSISVLPLPVPLPISIPSWLYAIAFILLSFFGMQRQAGNIGHDAHLGGAIIGLLITTALHPAIVPRSPLLYLAVMGLAAGLFAYLWINPLFLAGTNLLDRWRSSRSGKVPRRTEPREAVSSQEMDQLLDKISQSGMHSLTPRERKRLEELSRRA